MFKQSAKKIWMPAVWIVAIAIVGVAAIAGSSHLRARSARNSGTQVPASAAQSGRVRADLDALPLAFEANQGQTDPQVKYMARGKGYTAFLTADETVFAMESARATAGVTGKRALLPAQKTDKATKDETAAIRMKLVGAKDNAPIAAENELPGRSNYFIGNDRRQWHAGVKQYARVSYDQVYPGVSLAFHGQQKQLEFDFIVAPGADPKSIRFDVSGAKKISTDSGGNLVLASTAGDVVLHKPVTYQRSENTQQAVESRFVVAKNTVSFEVGNYDRSRELVIDPAVSYATYLGGSAEDDGYAITVNSAGNAYVTGQTKSTNFPTKNPLSPGTNAGGFDAFVTELSPDGSSLVFSTYIGGSGNDSGNAIALDGSDNIFVAGGTGSSNFPNQGALQTGFAGVIDAFVLELNPGGSALTYSTFLGGSGTDVISGLALDSSGNAYVVGSTNSIDFPTHNPIQTSIVGISSGFVTKVNASGNALVYSTYLGGGTGDFAVAVAVDGSGQAYVTGATKNLAFPTHNPLQASCGSDGTCNGGLYDIFVTVINAPGSGYVYSTFLGGEGNDEGFAIAVDSSKNAYITGLTSSTAFPTKTPIQGTFGGGSLPADAFVTEINAAGSALVYSTYLGGSGNDTGVGIAVDNNKNAYVTGQTSSANFPTMNPTQA
ncbi:MAG: SBBP repeat-containing protein, partial [Acidobacteriota bacterium]